MYNGNVKNDRMYMNGEASGYFDQGILEPLTLPNEEDTYKIKTYNTTFCSIPVKKKMIAAKNANTVAFFVKRELLEEDCFEYMKCF